MSQNTKRLCKAFLEGALSAALADLAARGLLFTADQLTYFSGHVIVLIILHLMK
jgi:hypothetical protein